MAGGLSRSGISERVADGRWRSIHPGVYLASHHQLTGEARVRAAALWAGPDATVCGVAAAWWHGMWPSCSSTVDVTVPRRRAPRPRPGVRLRRRDLDARDRVDHRGVAVTALPLTVVEAAVALGDDGPQLLDRALQSNVRFIAVSQAHHRNLGRRGSRLAGRMLVAAGDRADSQAERVLKGLLRAAGLRGWRCGYAVDGYLLDFAFVEKMVAVEVDGWAWHSDTVRFHRDRQRQNTLVLGGWTVLRFTWQDLTQRPDGVIADIRAAVG